MINSITEEILKKIKDALEQEIKVIYCIGESKEEKNRRVEYQVLERQIARIFNKLSNEELKNIIIAYEPGYLIGNNTSHNIEKIASMINFIKTLVKDYYNINLTSHYNPKFFMKIFKSRILIFPFKLFNM